jgi:hypothetical protein
MSPFWFNRAPSMEDRALQGCNPRAIGGERRLRVPGATQPEPGTNRGTAHSVLNQESGPSAF